MYRRPEHHLLKLSFAVLMVQKLMLGAALYPISVAEILDQKEFLSLIMATDKCWFVLTIDQQLITVFMTQ